MLLVSVIVVLGVEVVDVTDTAEEVVEDGPVVVPVVLADDD